MILSVTNLQTTNRHIVDHGVPLQKVFFQRILIFKVFIKYYSLHLELCVFGTGWDNEIPFQPS